MTPRFSTVSVAQVVAGWMTAAPDDRTRPDDPVKTVGSIRWRLWHGQSACARTLIGDALIGETLERLAPPAAEGVSARAGKVFKVLRALETHVAGHAAITIDYATARRRHEPISTATTDSTVQRLLHRRMGTNQQMRWSPRGAHPMLQVRTAVLNDTFAKDHVEAEMLARHPTLRAA